MAVADSATVDAGDSVLIDVLANDHDAEHQLLTLASVGQPLHGTAVVEQGQVRYTSGAGNFAADDFHYVVADSAGATATGDVHVSVGARPNHAPTLDVMADVNVKEGETLTVSARAHDLDGGDTLRYALDAPLPAGARIDPLSGVITWRATDGDSRSGFTVRVSDAAGASATRSFTVNVANVAPTLTAGGLPVAYVGERFTLYLSSADPGEDSIRNWRIDWGDGQFIDYPGNPRQLVHSYAGVLGPLQIRAIASDEDGSYRLDPLPVLVLPRPLQLQFPGQGIIGTAGTAGSGQQTGIVGRSLPASASPAAAPPDSPARAQPGFAADSPTSAAEVFTAPVPLIDFQPRPAGFRLPVDLRRNGHDEWRKLFVTNMGKKVHNPNETLRVAPGPSLQFRSAPDEPGQDADDGPPAGTPQGTQGRGPQETPKGTNNGTSGEQERVEEGSHDASLESLMVLLPLLPLAPEKLNSILGRNTWQTRRSNRQAAAVRSRSASE
ncbi:MAG: hypothetical protein KDI64_11505 [Candidatus Accumulibacter sp.]|nr:hypothetical protein [Accumulibacter sp.]